MQLGLDLGTASLKALAWSGGREWVASAPYPVASPEPLWAETEPEQWLAALAAALGRLAAAGAPLGACASIGLSGQMHGIVPVSRRHGALGPAILWADRRAADLLPRFTALPEGIRAALRNPPATGMAALSMLWLKENRPDLYARTEVFLFPKDYLRWRLTGEIATERTDASGSLLFDCARAAWQGELLERLGLDPGKLPPIRPSAEVGGRVTPQAAALTGLPAGTPVARGAADTAAALYGSGLADSGCVQISAGSGLQVARLAQTLPAPSPCLNLYAAAQPGAWYRLAAMLNGGVALEWVRGILGLEWAEAYAALEAAPEPPLDLLFLPYLAGERTPYLDPGARGAWIGLALHHGRLDLLRAALMGVAMSLRLGLETLGDAGAERWNFVGGSARHPYWTRLLASVLERPLSVSGSPDLSARGAALLGARAAGLAPEPGPGEAETLVEPGRIQGLEDYYSGFKAAYRKLADPPAAAHQGGQP